MLSANIIDLHDSIWFQVHLERGDLLLLLDNSDANAWKVRKCLRTGSGVKVLIHSRSY